MVPTRTTVWLLTLGVLLWLPGLFYSLLPTLAPFPALSLSSSRALTQFDLSIWQSENGLPQNTVYSIAQTPDGYLWFGTAEGVARSCSSAFGIGFAAAGIGRAEPFRGSLRATSAETF